MLLFLFGSGFRFGPRSLLALRGVHPKLKQVITRALELSESDFTVTEGLRSLATQKAYVASGASKTLNSKHLKQLDGYAHAADLAPYVKGQGVRYYQALVFQVAIAMQKAAIELGIPIRWGGAWNQDFMGGSDPENLQQAYIQHKRLKKEKPFIDAVHFELMT